MKNNGNKINASTIFIKVLDFLTLLFCTLRACDVITWPWYAIMAPVFIAYGIAIIGLIVLGIIGLNGAIEDDRV